MSLLIQNRTLRLKPEGQVNKNQKAENSYHKAENSFHKAKNISTVVKFFMAFIPLIYKVQQNLYFNILHTASSGLVKGR